jgi:hypothetical protein
MRIGSGHHRRCIDEQTARRILGFERRVPLSPTEMASGLRVTFYPIHEASERVRTFTGQLRQALVECGVDVIGYDAARDPARTDRLQEGLVVIAAGESPLGDLPIDHVPNLRKTTIVGIVDGPCPAEEGTTDQTKLNSIVRTLGWYVVQTVIYVEENLWTVCTMNGAIIPCPRGPAIAGDVLSILVPKLAAPVVPPHAADFEVRPGALDLGDPKVAPYIDDFVQSGPLWEQTDLFLFHTSLDALEFRSPFYKRIVAAYLDHRSGMSYGFLARQTAVNVRPAVPLNEEQEIRGDAGMSRLMITVLGKRYALDLPDVWVFTTRSGCDKAHLDPRRDVLLMGLSAGRVIFETPRDLDPKIDCRPSYDTLTILAHAVGNAVVASILASIRPESPFPRNLKESGCALAHWHGAVDPRLLPAGYAVYGEANPPVSCSTHQAALFALMGKITAVNDTLERGGEFRGDLHIEPHHGVNMTGPSLSALAHWALASVAPSALPGGIPRSPA